MIEEVNLFLSQVKSSNIEYLTWYGRETIEIRFKNGNRFVLYVDEYQVQMDLNNKADISELNIENLIITIKTYRDER